MERLLSILADIERVRPRPFGRMLARPAQADRRFDEQQAVVSRHLERRPAAQGRQHASSRSRNRFKTWKAGLAALARRRAIFAATAGKPAVAMPRPPMPATRRLSARRGPHRHRIGRRAKLVRTPPVIRFPAISTGQSTRKKASPPPAASPASSRPCTRTFAGRQPRTRKANSRPFAASSAGCSLRTWIPWHPDPTMPPRRTEFRGQCMTCRIAPTTRV